MFIRGTNQLIIINYLEDIYRDRRFDIRQYDCFHRHFLAIVVYVRVSKFLHQYTNITHIAAAFSILCDKNATRFYVKIRLLITYAPKR